MTTKLKTLKTRTGLNPNILCRLALCYSLEHESYNDLLPLTVEDGQEFNRYTLFGQYDLFFISLIKEKCVKEGLDAEKDFMKQLKFHINNGINILNTRVKSLSDLTNLIE